MNIIQSPVADAFRGLVPDVERSSASMPAYEGTQNHMCLPVTNPTFRFSKDAFMMLAYVWSREWQRSESDPRRGVWFGGPKGAGKTTLVEQFFARIGVPVVSLTCNRRIPLSDYVRQMVPDGEGGWLSVPGPLVVAMQEGFPVVLNEPSAMDPADLVAMHDLIDRGLLVQEDGSVIRASRGFLVFATDNTFGQGDDSGSYAGANTLSAATMSRFLKFNLDYPGEKEEVAILEARFNGQSTEALQMFVKLANMVRASYTAGASQVTMGTRELIDWVECTLYFNGLSASGRNPAWFALQRVVGGGAPHEMVAIRQHFEAVYGCEVDA